MKLIVPESYVKEGHPLKETVDKLVKEGNALLFKSDEAIARREADVYLSKYYPHLSPLLKKTAFDFFIQGYQQACRVLEHI